MDSITVQIAVTAVGAVLNVVVSVMVALAWRVLRGVQDDIKQRQDEIREVKKETKEALAEVKGDLKERVDKVEKALQDVEQQQREQDKTHATAMARILEMLPQTYVDRADFARTMASFDKKIDSVLGIQIELRRNFERPS